MAESSYRLVHHSKRDLLSRDSGSPSHQPKPVPQKGKQSTAGNAKALRVPAPLLDLTENDGNQQYRAYRPNGLMEGLYIDGVSGPWNGSTGRTRSEVSRGETDDAWADTRRKALNGPIMNDKKRGTAGKTSGMMPFHLGDFKSEAQSDKGRRMSADQRLLREQDRVRSMPTGANGGHSVFPPVRSEMFHKQQDRPHAESSADAARRAKVAARGPLRNNPPVPATRRGSRTRSESWRSDADDDIYPIEQSFKTPARPPRQHAKQGDLEHLDAVEAELASPKLGAFGKHRTSVKDRTPAGRDQRSRKSKALTDSRSPSPEKPRAAQSVQAVSDGEEFEPAPSRPSTRTSAMYQGEKVLAQPVRKVMVKPAAPMGFTLGEQRQRAAYAEEAAKSIGKGKGRAADTRAGGVATKVAKISVDGGSLPSSNLSPDMTAKIKTAHLITQTTMSLKPGNLKLDSRFPQLRYMWAGDVRDMRLSQLTSAMVCDESNNPLLHLIFALKRKDATSENLAAWCNEDVDLGESCEVVVSFEPGTGSRRFVVALVKTLDELHGESWVNRIDGSMARDILAGTARAKSPTSRRTTVSTAAAVQRHPPARVKAGSKPKAAEDSSAFEVSDDSSKVEKRKSIISRSRKSGTAEKSRGDPEQSKLNFPREPSKRPQRQFDTLDLTEEASNEQAKRRSTRARHSEVQVSYREEDEDVNMEEGPVEVVVPNTTVPRPENPSNVLFPYPLTGKADVNITEGEKWRVEAGDFLNDILIEFGLKHVLSLLEKPQQSAQGLDAESTSGPTKEPPLIDRDIYLFNSFFYEKISARSKPGEKTAIDWPAYQSVRKWTKGKDIFQKKFLIIPINENAHWYLAVIYNPKGILREPPEPVEEVEDKPSRAGAATRSSRASSAHNEQAVLAQLTRAPARSATPGPSRTRAESDARLRLSEGAEQDEDADLNVLLTPPPRSPPTTPAITPATAPATTPAIKRIIQQSGENGTSPFSAAGDTSTATVDPLDVIEIGEMEGKSADVPHSNRLTTPPSHPDIMDLTTPEGGRPIQSDTYGYYHEAGQPSAAVKDDAARGLTNGAGLKADKGKHVPNGKGKGRVREDLVILDGEDTWIMTFDSLGGAHKAVERVLGKWLQFEARDKLARTHELTPARYREARVPQQPNFSDCGLYLIHYVHQLLTRPEEIIRLIETALPGNGSDRTDYNDEVNRVWKNSETSQLRSFWTSMIESLTLQHAAARKLLPPPDPAVDGAEEDNGDELEFRTGSQFERKLSQLADIPLGGFGADVSNGGMLPAIDTPGQAAPNGPLIDQDAVQAPEDEDDPMQGSPGSLSPRKRRQDSLAPDLQAARFVQSADAFGLHAVLGSSSSRPIFGDMGVARHKPIAPTSDLYPRDLQDARDDPERDDEILGEDGYDDEAADEGGLSSLHRYSNSISPAPEAQRPTNVSGTVPSPVRTAHPLHPAADSGAFGGADVQPAGYDLTNSSDLASDDEPEPMDDHNNPNVIGRPPMPHMESSEEEEQVELGPTFASVSTNLGHARNWKGTVQTPARPQIGQVGNELALKATAVIDDALRQSDIEYDGTSALGPLVSPAARRQILRDIHGSPEAVHGSHLLPAAQQIVRASTSRDDRSSSVHPPLKDAIHRGDRSTAWNSSSESVSGPVGDRDPSYTTANVFRSDQGASPPASRRRTSPRKTSPVKGTASSAKPVVPESNGHRLSSREPAGAYLSGRQLTHPSIPPPASRGQQRQLVKMSDRLNTPLLLKRNTAPRSSDRIRADERELCSPDDPIDDQAHQVGGNQPSAPAAKEDRDPYASLFFDSSLESSDSAPTLRADKGDVGRGEQPTPILETATGVESRAARTSSPDEPSRAQTSPERVGAPAAKRRRVSSSGDNDVQEDAEADGPRRPAAYDVFSLDDNPDCALAPRSAGDGGGATSDDRPVLVIDEDGHSKAQSHKARQKRRAPDVLVGSNQSSTARQHLSRPGASKRSVQQIEAPMQLRQSERSVPSKRSKDTKDDEGHSHRGTDAHEDATARSAPKRANAKAVEASSGRTKEEAIDVVEDEGALE